MREDHKFSLSLAAAIITVAFVVDLTHQPSHANTREDNIAVGLGKVCTRVAALEKEQNRHNALNGHIEMRILELERKVAGMQNQITILHAKKANRE